MNTLRTIGIFLSVLLLVVSNFRVARDWYHWDRRDRIVRTHLTAFIFCIGYGMTEIRFGWDFQIRLVMVICVQVSLLAWLYVSRNDPATTNVVESQS